MNHRYKDTLLDILKALVLAGTGYAFVHFLSPVRLDIKANEAFYSLSKAAESIGVILIMLGVIILFILGNKILRISDVIIEKSAEIFIENAKSISERTNMPPTDVISSMKGILNATSAMTIVISIFVTITIDDTGLSQEVNKVSSGLDSMNKSLTKIDHNLDALNHIKLEVDSVAEINETLRDFAINHETMSNNLSSLLSKKLSPFDTLTSSAKGLFSQVSQISTSQDSMFYKLSSINEALSGPISIDTVDFNLHNFPPPFDMASKTYSNQVLIDAAIERHNREFKSKPLWQRIFQRKKLKRERNRKIDAVLESVIQHQKTNLNSH